jgi:hypothetical protein
MAERRVAYRVLLGTPEGRRRLDRRKCRWGILLKWILQKWDGGMDWINLAQDRDRCRLL